MRRKTKICTKGCANTLINSHARRFGIQERFSYVFQRKFSLVASHVAFAQPHPLKRGGCVISTVIGTPSSKPITRKESLFEIAHEFNVSSKCWHQNVHDLEGVESSTARGGEYHQFWDFSSYCVNMSNYLCIFHNLCRLNSVSIQQIGALVQLLHLVTFSPS